MLKKKLVKVLSQPIIITIVVLLILVVVAIGIVKESGIIAYAQNSETTYKTKSR